MNTTQKDLWSISDIDKLFKMKGRAKSRKDLLEAEESGLIPSSERFQRGSTSVRKWHFSKLPDIGKKYGFLKQPREQRIICVYTTKGGVLKTTFSYNLARILALNGIKTIIIGLDIQCSITNIVIPPEESNNLDQVPERCPSLYQFLIEKKSIDDVIKHTEFHTLDIIPESPDLNILEKKIRILNRREYIFQDKLISKLSDYQVIIFDNGPSWNQLIENALTASNVVLSPIGCDIGAYQAIDINMSALSEFKESMALNWDRFLLIPTLLEKTKLSQQIYGSYINRYPETVISAPIRRAVKGQESIFLRKSVLENDPTSNLAQDYYELLTSIWNKIN
jgi:chromosome partitioning protein